MNTIQIDVDGYFRVTRYYKAHYSLDVPISEIMSHHEEVAKIRWESKDERSWDELEEYAQGVLIKNFIHDNHGEDFELCENNEPPFIRGVKPIITGGTLSAACAKGDEFTVSFESPNKGGNDARV